MKIVVDVHESDMKKVEKLRRKLEKAFEKLYPGDISIAIKRVQPLQRDRL
tara:strand:- start:400 stop:549 length:150 start_codon:yes stop_codon:yes gene_type:complete